MNRLTKWINDFASSGPPPNYEHANDPGGVNRYGFHTFLTADRLAALLKDAEDAHRSYETHVGLSAPGWKDSNWPEWYAQYMIEHQ